MTSIVHSIRRQSTIGSMSSIVKAIRHPSTLGSRTTEQQPETSDSKSSPEAAATEHQTAEKHPRTPTVPLPEKQGSSTSLPPPNEHQAEMLEAELDKQADFMRQQYGVKSHQCWTIDQWRDLYFLSNELIEKEEEYELALEKQKEEKDKEREAEEQGKKQLQQQETGAEVNETEKHKLGGRKASLSGSVAGITGLLKRWRKDSPTIKPVDRDEIFHKWKNDFNCDVGEIKTRFALLTEKNWRKF
ncbi:unnamed protein product [Ambrosiozyma monospora]|uniref:Unnamed protein product n=1 Tax=Ambrosiozyma monospora TaxID=43982 RepID=A0A9W7DI06_AMBMO|nr:unnamed protein product [Ambrosiozyma monospora]